MNWFVSKNSGAVAGLVLGGLLWRGAIAVWLPPGFDEGYYYLYTQHLDWSYFDHPLLIALSTGFGVWLTGEVSPFTLRMGTLLLHTGALLLLYLTGIRLFSTRAALITLTIATFIPIFLIGFGVLTLPDSPLIFFWTATLYMAAWEFFPHKLDTETWDHDNANPGLDRETEGQERAIKPWGYTPELPLQKPEPVSPPAPYHPSYHPTYHPTYRLALIGLLVGLACLSKYHGLALAIGLVGFCLTSSRHRAALLSPWTLVSLGLFLLAIAPILGWNFQHEWVSLRFQSGRAVPDRAYSLNDLLVTFLAGVAYLFPTFGFPLWWVSGQAWGQNVRQWWQGKIHGGSRGGTGDREQPTEIQSPSDGENLDAIHQAKISPSPSSPVSCRVSSASSLLLWSALPLMLGFTLMGGYRAILPTWAMPGFWSATLLLGEQAARWQQRSPRLIRRWLWGSGLVIASFLLVALLHVTLGTFQKPSRYALFGGFLAPGADASVQLIDIQQLRRGFTDSIRLRTALEDAGFVFTNDLYLAGQVGMAILAPKGSTDISLPQLPITCFDQDLRGFAFWSTRDQWVGRDGLLVTTAQQQKATIAQYEGYFQRIHRIADIPITRGGEIVQVVQVYECDRLLKSYPRPYGNS
ncbi:MAG: glycosyltransferase family 39 protein [Kovacikia sp.]